jgi:FkbM family methyltransferase
MASLLKSTGRDWPASWYARRLHKSWGRRRERSLRAVEVTDGSYRYRFICGNLMEYVRCAGLLVKEPGTCAWIDREVRPGDVFCDIGANIGLYSIMAGVRVGREGRVIAFEPHGANFASLVRNIAANDLAEVITPCNFALHDQAGFFEFNYASLVTGSSSSQLSGLAVPGREPFQAVVRELKRAETLDGLVDALLLPTPAHVKIDVDGNEPLILRGMQRILCSEARPRSISVEINVGQDDRVAELVEASGYRLAERNLSRSGEKMRRKESGGLRLRRDLSSRRSLGFRRTPRRQAFAVAFEAQTELRLETSIARSSPARS